MKVLWKTSLKPKVLTHVVTGTGRCGTVYMAKLLTSLGFPCGHESVFTNSGLEYAFRVLNGQRASVSNVSINDGKWLEDTDQIVADASYMAAPFLNHKLFETIKKIHVVRHPLKVVFSFLDGFQYFKSKSPVDGYHAFIYRHIPELTEEMTPVNRACLFWVLWNEMIEKSQTNLFYRVEESVDAIVSFLETNGDFFKNRRANSREKKFTHTLSEIPSGDIKDRFVAMGEKYGYLFDEPWFSFNTIEADRFNYIKS